MLTTDDLARLHGLLKARVGNKDRAADSPGGCECHSCGCVFIGGEQHDFCARCVAIEELDEMLPRALPELLRVYAAVASAPEVEANFLCSGAFRFSQEAEDLVAGEYIRLVAAPGTGRGEGNNHG